MSEADTNKLTGSSGTPGDRQVHGAAPLPSAIPSVRRTAALAGDILAGADAIAEFIYGDRTHRRKVYNLVETNRLPVFRLGVNICARRSVLLDWIETQERQQLACRSGLERDG